MIFYLILLGILLLWWFKNDHEKYGKYPPGPVRLPMIGNLVHVALLAEKNPYAVFKKLGNLYGDVMFLKVGQSDTVVFNSLDSINEMLSHEKAMGRFQFLYLKERNLNKNVGIIWGSGEEWQNLRRFTIRNLRDFGFGKSAIMDVVINEEIGKFHEKLSKEVASAPGNIIHYVDLFSIPVVNVLWRLVTGKSYEMDDPEILKWIQLNNDFTQATTSGADLSDPFPFLRQWFPHKMGKTKLMELNRQIYAFAKGLVDEHKLHFCSDREPETFLDVFRKKIEESKDVTEKSFTDEQFLFCLLDLFLAGSETSSNTLNFGMLYMTVFPEVQERIQSEIDQNVPRGIPIDSSMKPMLPYTCAAVLEMLRYSTVVPTAPREAIDDFYFRDYFIGKGTVLFPNFQSIHSCEKIWGDPKNFRPERFLNSDGTAIDPKIAERLKTFGGGKRYCLGQSLAELTIFLYFASTLRKFKFVKVSSTNPTLEPQVGMTVVVNPFNVRVIDRSAEFNN